MKRDVQWQVPLEDLKITFHEVLVWVLQVIVCRQFTCANKLMLPWWKEIDVVSYPRARIRSAKNVSLRGNIFAFLVYLFKIHELYISPDICLLSLFVFRVYSPQKMVNSLNWGILPPCKCRNRNTGLFRKKKTLSRKIKLHPQWSDFIQAYFRQVI